MWTCTTSGPVLVHTFECNHGAVLSLVVRGDTIFAGCQDGYVKVFDVETKTLVRTIIVQEVSSNRTLNTRHKLITRVEY
jgi:di- and tripeptidase